MPIPAVHGVERRIGRALFEASLGGETDSQEGLAFLDAIGVTLTLKRENALFCEGDAAHSYYKVVSGAIRGYRLLRDGRRHITDFFLDGDFIGFHTLATHAFSAEAVREATLVRYDRRRVDALVARSTHISQCLLARVCHELSQAQTRMLMLSRMTARERLAGFLARMAERKAGRDTETIALPMSRADIGDYLGLTTETVCRAFAQLKSNGVIAVPTPHEVMVLQPGKLATLAMGT